MTAQRPAALGPATPLVQWSALIAPAAAGIFAGSIVFDAAPAAQAALGWGWILPAVAGFALMTVSGKMARSKGAGRAALFAAAGVWLHSLLEGFTAGTGVAFGIAGGITIALGVLIHLIPEGVALFTVSTRAGLPAAQALARCAVTWLLVAAGFTAAQNGPALPAGLVGSGLALAAGTFAFLAWALWRGRDGGGWLPWASAALGFVWVPAIHL